MNYSLAIFILNDGARAVQAIYDDNGKISTFKTLDASIKVGDVCVVPSGTRHGMTTVKIVKTDIEPNYDSTEAMDWIVQKVDRAAYEKLLESEQVAVDRIAASETKRRREALRNQLLQDEAESMKALPISTMTTGQGASSS